MSVVEANLDGLVGPTHNYAGLSFGNVASQQFAFTVSNPRAAALQGLKKMKFLHDLGLAQMVMPPQLRPDMTMMRRLGFHSLKDVPAALLSSLYSASSMWVANAATVSPSADTADGKAHFTPANLISHFHRSLEPRATADYLKQLFPGEHFVHHDPLPAQAHFSDEGAANHMRLCATHGDRGVNIFVHGGASQKYPARQTMQSQEAIARLHGLDKRHVVLLRQNARAIDEGVFHNDVIAMSNERLLIYHEYAYESFAQDITPFIAICVKEAEFGIADAVKTYFFNSQLVTLPSGGMVVIAPQECEENPKARACFERLRSEGHMEKIHYLDVRESMKNGGGPACLRLRVALSEAERKAAHPGTWMNETLYNVLCKWIEKYYRDRITPDDLRDPLLAQESQAAMAELSQLLNLKIDLGPHDY